MICNLYFNFINFYKDYSNSLELISLTFNREYLLQNVKNLLYGSENCPDMIASSIEIARRGFKKFSKGWFYPIFNVDNLNEQWKQTLSGIEDWKSAFKEIKKSKMMYRFQLTDFVDHAVFRKFYKKLNKQIYIF